MKTEAALEPRFIVHPRDSERNVRVFPDLASARAHVRDHLLTAPECEAWALIAPGYAKVIAPGEDRQRLDLARHLEDDPEGTFLPLFEVYCQVLTAETADATILGWAADSATRDVTVTLGTGAVLCLIEDPPSGPGPVVRTAFIPGMGEPEAVLSAKRDDQGSLPRERPQRHQGTIASRTSERRQRQERGREDRFSWPERVYYGVFRPAVQFLRTQYLRNRDYQGRIIRHDYAMLKDVLPSCSQLKYESWLTFRQRCRGTLEAPQ
jgi:hypothetical protein